MVVEPGISDSGGLRSRDVWRRLVSADAGIFLAPGLVVLVIVAALSAYLTVESDQIAALARRANEMRLVNLELIAKIADAETSERGFLLTGDPGYLEPYTQATAQIPQMSRKLKDLAAAYPERQILAGRVEELAQLKLGEMQRTIELQKSGDQAAAIAVVRQNSGQRYFDELRSVLIQLGDQVNAEAEARRAEARALRQLLMGATVAALVLSATLSVIAVTRTRRQLGALREQQRSLASINEELERRVAARTAELEQSKAETERERDQIEALLADVNHRIGNNLQLVSSMLGFHARLVVGEEAKSALHVARNQVQAIASAQRRLRLLGGSDEVEVGSFLDGLLQDVRETLTAERPITIEFTSRPAKVTSKVAVSLGVVANELISNAVKHAFPDGRDGTIRVALITRGDGSIEELVVADDGIGVPMPLPEGRGLGGRIVQALTDSLNASLVVEAANPGEDHPGTRVRLVLREEEIPA